MRNRFKIDLSETTLGHATMSDLFKDVRLQGMCKVRLLENGYFLFADAIAYSQANVYTDVSFPAVQSQSVLSACTLSTAPSVSQGGNAYGNCKPEVQRATMTTWSGDIQFEQSCAQDFSVVAVPMFVFAEQPSHHAWPQVHERDGQTCDESQSSSGSTGYGQTCDESESSSGSTGSNEGDLIAWSIEAGFAAPGVSSSFPTTPRALLATTPCLLEACRFDLGASTSSHVQAGPDSEEAEVCLDVDPNLLAVPKKSWSALDICPRIEVRNTFIEIKSPVSGMARHAHSLPTTPWMRTVSTPSHAEIGSTSFADQILDALTLASEAMQCTDDALPMQNEGLDEAVTHCTDEVFDWTARAVKFAWDPQQITVRNTFVHMDSPESQLGIRAQSLPASPLSQTGRTSCTFRDQFEPVLGTQRQVSKLMREEDAFVSCELRVRFGTVDC
jgi:hypothetical protein